MPVIDWRPSVEDVAGFIRARTKDKYGNEPGTFNENTRPTGLQVEEYVDAVVARIEARTSSIPEVLQAQARFVTALGAAVIVEKTHWPEQVATGRSAYKELREEYLSEFKELLENTKSINDGNEPGDIGKVLDPQYCFPDECGMVGLDTRF